MRAARPALTSFAGSRPSPGRLLEAGGNAGPRGMTATRPGDRRGGTEFGLRGSPAT